MAKQSLRSTAVQGMIWMLMERILAQLVTFVVSVVLARILIPEAYGIVALAQVFINLANVFVTVGLNASLIQQDDIDDLDYSTALYTNIGLAVILYVILFIAAPVIADFYSMPLISPLLRVLGMRLIIGAYNSVQRAFVSRNLLFRKFFWSTLGGTLVSAVVGILMAVKGLGAWAIVGQYLTNSTIDTIVLAITVPWKPKLLFSVNRLKRMYSFGWKVLSATFLNTCYLEIRSMVIGREYSSGDLAFYNQGRQFPQLFYTNLSSAVTSVMFPVLSKSKNEEWAFNRQLHRTIQVLTYLIFPLMAGLIMTASPIVKIVLSEKWLPCVFFLKAYALSYAILPVQTVAEQALKAAGRSDLFLKLFFVEKGVGIALILVTMRISVEAIAVGMFAGAVFSTILHVLSLRHITNYLLKDFMVDISQNLLVTLLMCSSVFLVGLTLNSTLIKLIIQVITGVVVYITVSILIKNTSMFYIVEMINNRLRCNLLNKLLGRRE